MKEMQNAECRMQNGRNPRISANWREAGTAFGGTLTMLARNAVWGHDPPWGREVKLGETS
jgi:hypothetical protein